MTKPTYAAMVDRLVSTKGELEEARALLREVGANEGDASLSSQVHIHRHAAQVARMRQEAAELALRALRGHWVEAPMEIAAWKRATNQPLRGTA